MISSIFSVKANIKILKLFSLAPGKALSRKQIKELANLTNVSLDNALNKLNKEKIIAIEKRAIRLNLSNEKTSVILNIFKKESELLREIPYKIWLVLFEFSSSIEKTPFQKAFLFGSWAKHIARENSDIDIALINKEKNIKEEMLAEKIAEKLENKYKRKIQLHFFNEEEWEKAKISLIKEIKKDAIEIF